MKNKCKHVASGGGLYCLGFVGSLDYFVQQADSFGAGVLGVIQAFVWPALMAYEMLAFLNM